MHCITSFNLYSLSYYICNVCLIGLFDSLNENPLPISLRFRHHARQYFLFRPIVHGDSLAKDDFITVL